MTQGPQLSRKHPICILHVEFTADETTMNRVHFWSVWSHQVKSLFSRSLKLISNRNLKKNSIPWNSFITNKAKQIADFCPSLWLLFCRDLFILYVLGLSWHLCLTWNTHFISIEHKRLKLAANLFHYSDVVVNCIIYINWPIHEVDIPVELSEILKRTVYHPNFQELVRIN